MSSPIFWDLKRFGIKNCATRSGAHCILKSRNIHFQFIYTSSRTLSTPTPQRREYGKMALLVKIIRLAVNILQKTKKRASLLASSFSKKFKRSLILKSHFSSLKRFHQVKFRQFQCFPRCVPRLLPFLFRPTYPPKLFRSPQGY